VAAKTRPFLDEYNRHQVRGGAVIPSPTPAWWPEHLEVLDNAVEVSHLDVSLQGFLAAAAARHWSLFSLPLIVTSGNDGSHAPGSKHYEWKAVDLRSRDLLPSDQTLFAHNLVPMQEEFTVGIFDERFIGSPHWHVETP
jgi:hypothetical protein